MAGTTAHDTVVDQLRRYILAYGLQPGDMLPPLGDLARRFDVSVASLREAVRSLESCGVLTLRHGVGTFVQAYDYAPILENLSFSALFRPDMLQQFLQLREALEIGLLERAVSALSSDDLATLASLVDEMSTRETAQAAEYRFHTTLCATLRNDLVNGLLRLCWLAPRQLEEYVGAPPAAQPAHYAVHVELLAALRNRDKPAAQASLARYFGLLERDAA